MLFFLRYNKHSCPSGLRGSTQVRMYSYSWVQIPPNAIFSPVVKWLSPLTLNQLSSVRIRAGEHFSILDLCFGQAFYTFKDGHVAGYA